MGEQTRHTLREFFKAGRLPTEDHFTDLVDSMLNMKDEGFRKTVGNGLEVTALGESSSLMSFYRNVDRQNPVWTLAHGKEGRRLEIGQGVQPGDDRPAPALCLHVEETAARDGIPAGRAQRVGVNIEHPRHTLHVAGIAAAEGRVGTYVEERNASCLADGEWHTVVDGLTGCHAFEVMAGVGGGRGSGRFALLHAVALNTYNPLPAWLDWLRPRRGIRTTSAHYGRRCDRLELSWQGAAPRDPADPKGGKKGDEPAHGKDARYRLCIRTRCNYMRDGGGRNGPDVYIRFGVTRLWFDEHMTGSGTAE